MIYSSLAILALAASAAVPSASAAPSLGGLVHLHPHAQTDARVNVTVLNNSEKFIDLKIQDHIYTVNRHSSLLIKAPAGTVIYRGRATDRRHVGDALLGITPALNNTRVVLD